MGLHRGDRQAPLFHNYFLLDYRRSSEPNRVSLVHTELTESCILVHTSLVPFLLEFSQQVRSFGDISENQSATDGQRDLSTTAGICREVIAQSDGCMKGKPDLVHFDALRRIKIVGFWWSPS